MENIDIHPSLRHPSAPDLFWTSEGTYAPLDYITRVCEEVECTFSLWQGGRRTGCYVPAQPITYRQVSREQAYTRLVYALNTGDPSVNPWRQAYSAVHTREAL
jgi:hypothetical protein